MEMDEVLEATGKEQADSGRVALSELLMKLQTDTVIGDLRGEIEGLLGTLTDWGSRNREVMLLARIKNIKILLDRAPQADNRHTLIAEFERINEMLACNVEPKRSQIAQRAMITEPKIDEAKKAQKGGASKGRDSLTFVERYLESLSFIGSGQLETLRKQRLLDDDRFLSSDPAILAEIMDLSADAVLELKGQVQKNLKKERDREILLQVREVEKINAQLADECESITAENQALVESTQALHSRMSDISRKFDSMRETFRVKQGEAVASHIECNRLSIELKFLRDENNGLVTDMERTHRRLNTKLKVFTTIRNNCDFVKGECSVSEELLEYLGGLLNDVASQCESLGEKVVSAEDRLDSVCYQLNEITKEGKTLFYSKV